MGEIIEFNAQDVYDYSCANCENLYFWFDFGGKVFCAECNSPILNIEWRYIND